MDDTLKFISGMPGKKPKTFADVIERDLCRYIDGDPKNGTDTYCANKRLKGSSYCEHHATRCTTGKTARQANIENTRFKFGG